MTRNRIAAMVRVWKYVTAAVAVFFSGSTLPLCAEDVYAGGFRYRIDDGEASLCHADTLATDAVIPGTITVNGNTFAVTAIAEESFSNCRRLKKVIIPDGVKHIGRRAFFGCSKLKTIIIPESAVSFGKEAFSECVSLPVIRNVRYADTYLVEAVNKDRDRYAIRNGTRTIGEGAFSNCNSLKKIRLPETVISIGREAFLRCGSLENIRIPLSVESIGSDAFKGCRLDDDHGIVYAGPLLLYAKDRSIVECKIRKGTKWIGSGAFCDCRLLEKVVIPDGTLEIGNNAFLGCRKLKSINIPASVEQIGNAFSGCSSLPVTDGIRYADTYLIEAVDLNIETCSIREGTRWIGNSAFRECDGLRSVSIPETVVSIGESAFEYCNSLEWAELPECLTSIGCSVFSNCRSLEHVNIPDGITRIPQFAFYNCRKLTSVRIPDGVCTIGDGAFDDCTGLIHVNIPKGTVIEGTNFENCSSLPAENGVVYLGEWVAGTNDVHLKSAILKQGTKHILSGAFRRCPKLETVVIPEGVQSIGANSFSKCRNLKSANIPNSVTFIGAGAFSECEKLKLDNLPEKVVEELENLSSDNGHSGIVLDRLPDGSLSGTLVK